ncbi:MAG: fasciclin domain-containing protein [Anaerolineae bacterium]|nr:fasciclin domain-containing protein [Anaerolineae bacterium]NUQ06649.1 fasciclin domain-containing protein [Anaerolineae bacterium]
MKIRMLSVAALLVVALLAVVPSFAQDDASTIAEIVVASAGAESPEFTVLLAAVSAADPAVLELLSSPAAGVTVFAPTDAAFAAALEALGVSAEDLLADTDMLTNILLYHVVPGVFAAEAVVALDGALLGTMSPETALAISAGDMGVMVNESNVVTADVMASNGVVHVIDAVLLPPAMDDMAMGDDMMMEEPAGNIAEVVIASAGAEAPEFTTLLTAVQAADPAILATLTGAGPYTVFAPTDAAFAAALEALGITAEQLLSDVETLTTVLAYHVVPGHFASPTVVAVAGAEGGVNIATALAGTTVNISLDGDSVKVNDATVVTVDVHATNGIIHVIDSVILPPG